MFWLTKLNALFKDIVAQTEGVDIEVYKAHSLKQRLHKSHPFLKFHKASTTFLVYVDNLSPEEFLQDLGTSSSSSEDSDGEMCLEMEKGELDNVFTDTKDDYRLLYIMLHLPLKKSSTRLQNHHKNCHGLPLQVTSP